VNRGEALQFKGVSKGTNLNISIHGTKELSQCSGICGIKKLPLLRHI
jgi:hypothetical protein